MRKKVGLFLGADPLTGGTFQYNQAMLEAFKALPDGEFETLIGYVYPGWAERLRDSGLQTLQLRHGAWNPTATKVFGIHPLLLRAWRKWGCSLHPVVGSLHEARCDLWVFPSQDPLTYQAGVPALGVIHDLMHRYEPRFPEVSGQGRRAYRDIHYRAMCRYSAGILVDSEIGRSHVHESYGLERVKIHTLPYVAPTYMNEGDDPVDFEARVELPSKFIFYPAQFWEHKNHGALLDAVALLKERYPDLVLVLSGSPKNAYRAVRERVARQKLHGHVRFLGYLPDSYMPGIYRRARALVMPSFFGPTNIPPLEGFVAGCPVAVSDVYGMREQAGDAALYFDPRSVTSISGVIEQLWTQDDLCRDLSRKGRRKAADWGQPQFNLRLAQILGEVLSQ